jgi:hypothetical protein
MRRDTLLVATVAGTGAFGAFMVLAPALTRQGYGLLMYGDAARIDAFPPEALAYVTLLHGVLGAVMLGWAVALMLLLRGPWRVALPVAWRIVATSVVAWYVVDTGYSAAVGAWPNVALNTVFALLYAVALGVARGAGSSKPGQAPARSSAST